MLPCEIEFVEFPIYGLGREGLVRANIIDLDAAPPTTKYTRELGRKYYELSDHLGNPRVIITDRLLSDVVNGTPGKYRSDIVSYSNQYPYGMEQPGRYMNGSGYRYGYNGMERDSAVTGGHHTTYFRQYDARLGRFWSTDPLTHSWESPYVAMGGNPIALADPSGAEPGDPEEKEKDRNLPQGDGGEDATTGRGEEEPGASGPGYWETRTGVFHGIRLPEVVVTGSYPTFLGGLGDYFGDQFVGAFDLATSNEAVDQTVRDVGQGVVNLGTLGAHASVAYNPLIPAAGRQMSQDYVNGVTGGVANRVMSMSAYDWGYRTPEIILLMWSGYSIGRNVYQGVKLAGEVGGGGMAMRGAVASGERSVVAAKTSLTSNPYAGVQEASAYLRAQGIPREIRKQVFQSFYMQTIKVRQAGVSEYGLRYFDNVNAFAEGRYLFETFPASRASLALDPRWNKMTYFTQWQIRPGATLFEGVASPQGGGLPGGQIQKYVPNINDLLSP